MKKSKGLNNNRIIYLATISSIAVGIIIILIGMSYYKFRISRLGISDNTNYKEFKEHYAIISEDKDETFWDDIYQGALKKGKAENIYVEKVGSHLSTNYSLDDLMKIAIASKVDGIILEPDGGKNIKKLIDEADAVGIPVVTVINDVPLSKRKSFIGINSYNEGQAYGRQVLDLVKKGKRNITVLLNSKNKNARQNVIYSSILETVGSHKVEVKSAAVNTQSSFSSEEDIRNIIMNTKNPTDVLVCLNATDTMSAFQAIVDYNKVGQIEIIGYYDSDIILEAIEKNIVHSTMTIDANLMGAYCVEALSEYRNTGRVSDYYSVYTNVVNSVNVEHYLKSSAKNGTQ